MCRVWQGKVKNAVVGDKNGDKSYCRPTHKDNWGRNTLIC